MPDRSVFKTAAAALCLALTAGLAPSAVTPAGASDGRFHNWAPRAEAAIRPGNWVETSEGDCTTNFVFTDKDRNVYLGLAAHCFSTSSDPTDTNGCTTPTRPAGATATIEGARYKAVLAYSSWRTMQKRGERGSNACAHNDFALLRLARSDRIRVNPTVPHWGGPDGVAGGADPGDKVAAYTNSIVWLEQPTLRRKQGSVTRKYGNGWKVDVRTTPPGVPGDSGSGYLKAGSKAALGVLSVVKLFPDTGDNGVVSLRLALKYMKSRHGGLLDTIQLTDAHR